MDYKIGYVWYEARYGYKCGIDSDGDPCFTTDINRAYIVPVPHDEYTVKVGYTRLYYTNHRVYFKEHKGRNAGKISAHCYNCRCTNNGKPKACAETAEKSLRENNPECSILSVWKL